MQRTRHLLGAPVRMGMRGFDELCTPRNSLWGPMSLDQLKQLIQLTGSQEERTVRTLMRYAAPPWKRPSRRRTMLFLEHLMQSSLFLASRRRYELVPGCTKGAHHISRFPVWASKISTPEATVGNCLAPGGIGATTVKGPRSST